MRGFKLGQTYDEVMKGLAEEADPVMYFYPESVRHMKIESSLRVARLFDKPSPWLQRFEGVESVKLIFLDDKMAGVSVAYDRSTTWLDPLEFTASIAHNLRLPKKGWHGRQPTRLDCAGFTVLTYGEAANPTLTIKLPNLDGELVTRKYEALRKKRETFKP